MLTFRQPPASNNMEAKVFDAIVLSIKRKKLMRQFMCHQVKYQAQYLGRAMASAENEDSYAHDRERLQEAIQEVCAKKDIEHEDMNLIEDELNDYINVLVRAAFEDESKKLQKRELVNGRIKIKRVVGLE